ncbi:hypothetical protein AADG42_10130 [Ammonicoccus fulvus]|uniref:Uncharacterized protein n=1 Tax=Ammonicoccus fulvus TaxID=3138240 RepID=A0ABZ3FS79_9ACTN
MDKIPPPGYSWTEREKDGDMRRAASFLHYQLTDDPLGIHTVLAEAVELDRLFPLILALGETALFGMRLHIPETRLAAHLQDMVLTFATEESKEC